MHNQVRRPADDDNHIRCILDHEALVRERCHFVSSPGNRIAGRAIRLIHPAILLALQKEEQPPGHPLKLLELQAVQARASWAHAVPANSIHPHVHLRADCLFPRNHVHAIGVQRTAVLPRHRDHHLLVHPCAHEDWAVLPVCYKAFPRNVHH